MREHKIVLILALVVVILFSSRSYASGEKTILILLDQMDFKDMEKILQDSFGVGLMNLKTRSPRGDESFYFSIAAGRKVGVNSGYYKGLYKNQDGSISVVGYELMFKSLIKGNKSIGENILGERLKDQGISYIGENSSAILAADTRGNIQSGEIKIEYDKDWLIDKTNLYLSKSNILVLSYEIGESDKGLNILKAYIEEFKDHNIVIIPKQVSNSMKWIINNNISPVVFINGSDKGTLISPSTKREGFITIEDIHAEVLSIYGEEDSSLIGNNIQIVEREDNISHIKDLFKRNLNLMWITYFFHGLVYFTQLLTAYFIYKNKRDKIGLINIINNFIIINIFISLLMGITRLHGNIILYLLINLLISYITTIYMVKRGLNTIQLFPLMTYGFIVIGILFNPEIIYNSYIGFNNLFYGARYYGFNNGIMGVILVSSIIAYYFIDRWIKNDLIRYTMCLFFVSTNLIILSANFGANTGGFLTALALFLIMVYRNIISRGWNIRKIILLILLGILIFVFNMYFDYLSHEKSHAINFFIRINNLGFSEFIDMVKVKGKELIKLTLLPPFSIAIISQLSSLKFLFRKIDEDLRKESYIILITGIIGFILNDTGMITFIYMCHYLISLLISSIIKNPSRI